MLWWRCSSTQPQRSEVIERVPLPSSWQPPWEPPLPLSQQPFFLSPLRFLLSSSPRCSETSGVQPGSTSSSLVSGFPTEVREHMGSISQSRITDQSPSVSGDSRQLSHTARFFVASFKTVRSVSLKALLTDTVPQHIQILLQRRWRWRRLRSQASASPRGHKSFTLPERLPLGWHRDKSGARRGDLPRMLTVLGYAHKGQLMMGVK